MTSLPHVQQLNETAKNSIEHFVAVADIVLNASEQLVGLNIDAARSACELASTKAAALASADIKDQFSNHVAGQGETFEKAAAYLRNVNEICVKTNAEVAELNARHAGEFAQSVQSLFESIAKFAPVGAFDFASLVPAKSTKASKSA